MLEAGVARGGQREPTRPARRPPRAARSGFQDLLDGDVEAMKTKTRRYAKRQVTWLRKLPGAHLIDTTAAHAGGRRRRADRHDLTHMRFEKWQALGNDYLIFEEAAAVPGPGPAAVRPAFRARRGRRAGADASPTSRGSWRACGSSTRTASEAELSGNGAREAILYLRRKRLDATPTRSASRRWRARSARRSPSPTTCTVDMGRAHLTSPNFPEGPPDGQGELEADGQTFRFQHVAIGNPQCAIRVDDPDAIDIDRHRPADRERADLPEPHQRQLLARARRPTRSARGSSSAAWGRRSPAAPARAARRSRTSCAAATRPSPSSSTAAS